MIHSKIRTAAGALALLALAPVLGVPAAPAAPAVARALLPRPALHAQSVTERPAPTRLVVRVVANDAKAIGSGVGGARVTVRHAETGEVLAQGTQEGSTGNTAAIMGPHERGATVFAHEGTAAFETTLELSGPTPVIVEAEAPLGTPHAVRKGSTEILLLPGVDVDGEGVILTLHGFTVVIEEPAAGYGTSLEGGGLPVRVNVTMLCGCPIEPGGLWDADRIDVEATLLADGKVVTSTPLLYAGETSTFAGVLHPPADGTYEILVTAHDAERANAGLARRGVTVRGR